MMETRVYYFPRNTIGRYVLNSVVERVSCSVGNIRKAGDTLAVTITTPKQEIPKINRILQTYDLI